MKRVAYVVGGSLMFFLGLAACSSDSTSSTGAGTTQGAGGGAGDTSAAGMAGTTGTAGSTSGTTGGSGGSSTNPFGGGGKAGTTGTGGKAGGTTAGGGGSGSGTCPGGIQTKAGACGDCINSMCCTESTACQDEPNCIPFVQCVSQCQDQACADKCDTDNPGGKAAFDGLNTCAGSTCKTECASGSGGSGGSGTGICDSKLTTNDATCDMCLGTMGTCCADTKACLADAECKDCLTNPMADQTKCMANANAQKFQACIGTTCKTQCSGGGMGGGTGSGICDSKVTTQNATCDMCLGGDAACCGSFKACVADATCKACLGMQQPGADCMANKSFTEINTCLTSTCKTQCGG